MQEYDRCWRHMRRAAQLMQGTAEHSRRTIDCSMSELPSPHRREPHRPVQSLCRDQGSVVTVHNIRGSALTRPAEAGCEVPENPNHHGALAQGRRGYPWRTTKLAVSAVAKLERTVAAAGADGNKN